MNNTVITGVEPLTARTYSEAVVLEGDDSKGTVANGWYDDSFVRTEHGLQISRRIHHMVSMRNIGPNLGADLP